MMSVSKMSNYTFFYFGFSGFTKGHKPIPLKSCIEINNPQLPPPYAYFVTLYVTWFP